MSDRNAAVLAIPVLYDTLLVFELSFCSSFIAKRCVHAAEINRSFASFDSRKTSKQMLNMDYNTSVTPGFCADCGSILPLMRMTGTVHCYNCHKVYNEGAFGTMEVAYTIHFNSYENKKAGQQQDRQKADAADGPIVSRKCPKCGNDKMSYATLQLRSADEGQTVFFTCTKCQFKEAENS